jgi:hypothetical protein
LAGWATVTGRAVAAAGWEGFSQLLKTNATDTEKMARSNLF